MGRPLLIINPDTTTVQHRYGIYFNGTTYWHSHAVIDENSHQRYERTDALGRLVQLVEDSGNGSSSSWTSYATTLYSYNALDLLTKTTDQLGNSTLLSYESAGRKQSSTDPDMGSWSYTYDSNGNLLTQRDAKLQMITFSYDALNRLTGKSYPNGTLSAATFNYDEAGVPNGKGQRTSMINAAATVRWTYDLRGHQASVSWSNIPGTTSTRSLAYSYDSAERVASIQYQTNGSTDETVTYSYDAGWRPSSACSSVSGTGCYANLASYTALDQPLQWTLGNYIVPTWSYLAPMQRLQQLDVPGVLSRSYQYDNAGNVRSIQDNRAGQTQTFSYDEQNRLTHGSTSGGASGSYDESYTYDAIGNLKTKGAYSYTYPTSGPGSVRPHAVSSRTNGTTTYPYNYDTNGNMCDCNADGTKLAGAGKLYSFNVENQPASVTGYDNVQETYTYDADGERISRTRNGITTAYMGGLLEADLGQGVIRTLYVFNGQVVAQRTRTNTTNTVSYLHGDQLGSVAAVTNSSGALTSQQDFLPFGDPRGSTSIGETTLNYTGQHKDGTALLYYHARYYDPSLGRFASPDSVVPGAARASGGGAATLGGGGTTPLTVDFHEPGFASQLNQHNAATGSKGFWFQLSGDEQQKAESPMGPANPQALNRYSYVLNNPLRYTDPTGHYQAIPTDGEGSEGGGWAPPDIVGGVGPVVMAVAKQQVAK
ncbi:MAG: RHS repeat-associated core domain-containing protein [Herpetosiphonaceae bacterium]|nr:RHS repeat-associated core domain-containing protein [Herpetosiphonaceae bacterium]